MTGPITRITAPAQYGPVSKVTFQAPVVRGKVNAVALNYRSHAGMSGGARPELFAKLPSAVVGPD